MKFKANGEQKTYQICGAQIYDTAYSGYYIAGIAGSTINGDQSLGISLISATPLLSGMSFTGNFIPGSYEINGFVAYIPM